MENNDKKSKKWKILQKWAKNGKNKPDYADSLLVLLRYAVLEGFREKYPEKRLISPENAVLEVLPLNSFLSLWLLEPLEFEKEIIDFAVSPNLKFPKESTTSNNLVEIDLRKIPCPKASVSARLLLSSLPFGAKVTFCLAEGSQIENIPSSLVADGYQIEKREKKEGNWKIFVLKSI